MEQNMNVRPLILGILATLGGACATGTGLLAAGANPGWDLVITDTNTGHNGGATFHNVSELSIAELDASTSNGNAVTAGSGSFTMPWTGFAGDAYLVSQVGSGDTFSIAPTAHGAPDFLVPGALVQGFPVTLDHLELTAENGIFANLTTAVSGSAAIAD
jgi:hypothetical protein